MKLRGLRGDGSGVGGAAAWVGVYSRRGSAKRSVRLICATLISLKKK